MQEVSVLNELCGEDKATHHYCNRHSCRCCRNIAALLVQTERRKDTQKKNGIIKFNFNRKSFIKCIIEHRRSCAKIYRLMRKVRIKSVRSLFFLRFYHYLLKIKIVYIFKDREMRKPLR